ncbi:MAG: CPBP family intramembrane glutamic endopeptidase [Methylophilaceae bacterium]
MAIQFLNGFYLPALAQSPVVFWIYDISVTGFLPVLIYFALTKLNVSPREYGFKKPYSLYTTEKVAGQALMLFMGAGIVYFIARSLLLALYPPSNSFFYGNVIPTEGILRLLAALFFSVSAGVVESAIYLGIAKLLIDEKLKGSAGRYVFVIVSTVVFASVHWEQGVALMITAGITQLIFSLAYLRINYLLPFIAAHAAIDFVIFY